MSCKEIERERESCGGVKNKTIESDLFSFLFRLCNVSFIGEARVRCEREKEDGSRVGIAFLSGPSRGVGTVSSSSNTEWERGELFYLAPRPRMGPFSWLPSQRSLGLSAHLPGLL